MCFTKYSLCETCRQGSCEISFVHLSISTIYFTHYTPVLHTGESTPLSINTLLEPSNHSLKRICYEISQESRQEGLEIFWEQKDVSSLVDDPPAGNLETRHDQSDLERSDKDSLKELIRRCQKCFDPQGSTFTDE